MSESSEPHHTLSPKPIVVTQSQTEELLSKFDLTDVYNLPKVKHTDKSLEGLSVKPGEVVKYARSTGDYYRVVID